MTLNEFITDWNSANPFLHVHTSGSTGKPKDLLVEKERMAASARMTCDFLGLKPGNTALLCMPLDYIAGKMVVVRSLVRGMRLISVTPGSRPLDMVDVHIDFAAMVPYQVKMSLDNPKLRLIDNLIIGGGAIDDALEHALRSFPNAVYSTYGMTETLSHIALRRISGEASSLWYTPFDGVSVSLNGDSCLVIEAPLVCEDVLVTNDIAELNAAGQFRILGRKDNTVNTGGVKVQIEEVERILNSSHIAITSKPDADFGEIVVMLVENSISAEEMHRVESAVKALPRYWQPKQMIMIDSIPLTGTGKIDRAGARRAACAINA